MDIGIFIEYDKQVVQIPVNPPEFQVQEPGSNTTVEIITLGEIVIPKKKKLASIKWDSFFPYESWHPAVRTKGDFQSAKFYLDFLNTIRDDCKPCRLIVTGIDFESQVVIEEFNYYHQAGDHEDTYYSISFKKYESHSVIVVPKVTSSWNQTGSGLGTWYNPGESTTNKVTIYPTEITLGAKVVLNGSVYRDSDGQGKGNTYTNLKCRVNLVNAGSRYPYHVTDNSGLALGWVSKGSVVLA